MLVAYLVVSAVQLVAEGWDAWAPAFIATLLAMPVLIGYLWVTRAHRDRLTRLVIVALLFSWLGDWVGDLISPHVLTKLLLFFVAHIFFVVAFWPYRRLSVFSRPAIVLYAVVIGTALAWIASYAGIIAPLIIVYGALLGLMALTATGLNRLTGIGGIAFVISDLSIGLTVFVYPGQFARAGLLIISSYLLAQLLIVRGVLERNAHDFLGEARSWSPMQEAGKS